MEDRNKVKHYEILSRLGEGGMGVVYRARDTRLGRIVALKMLHEELAGDEERTRRFEREARIISAMSHPGIATLYDYDREGDATYLAMELVEGPTLRQLLTDGPLPLDRALECAVQVAEALAAAHREGVVHRDLKPENIMVSASGYYKVLDFGVARMELPAAKESASSTQTPTVSWATRAGGIVGTVAYMSPEQALGEAVDTRSDLFSFGSLLYEMLTGKPAFRGNNEIATAQAIVNAEPEPVRSLRPKVSRGLALVLSRCLAKEPAERYSGAADLVEDLRALRAERLSDTRSVRGLHAYRESALRRRHLRIAAATAAGLLIAISTVLVWQPWRSTTVATPAPSVSAPAPQAVPAALRPRPRVVVAFFENNSGDPAADWLGRGLPEMLTTDLSRSPELEVIATQRLYDLLAASGRDPEENLDRSTASELARWAGADIVISGAVFKSGNRYRIDAQAFDTASGTVAVARKAEGEDLFAMVDELTAGLRQGLRVTSEDTGALQQVTTSSEDAFRDYSRGKLLYDRLAFDQAAVAFRRSLEADPGFALARMRLGMTLLSLGRPEEAAPLVEKAASEMDRMPEAERLLTGALEAYLVDGDFETVVNRLEAMAVKYPEDKDASILWARALSNLDERPARATHKLREALARDPGNLGAIAVLAEQLAALGANDVAREMIAEAVRSNPQAAEPLSKLLESLDES